MRKQLSIALYNYIYYCTFNISNVQPKFIRMMKKAKRKFAKDQEGSNLSQFGGEPVSDSFEGYMLSMALAYDNEPAASKTEVKRNESNRLCTIEATCGIEGIRTPQTAEPGFIGIIEDLPNKVKTKRW